MLKETKPRKAYASDLSDQQCVVFQPKWDSRQVSQGGLFCGGHNP